MRVQEVSARWKIAQEILELLRRHAFLNSGVNKYQSCFHKWETGNTDYILSNLSTFYHGIPEYRDRKIRRSLTQKLPEEFDEKFTKDDVKLANNR